MKKLLILILLLGLPAYAQFEVCEESGYKCLDFPAELISYIETTTEPTYGIKVHLKSGPVHFFSGNTRSSAYLMLEENYLYLQEEFNWSDEYTYSLIDKFDTAQLRIK